MALTPAEQAELDQLNQDLGYQENHPIEQPQGKRRLFGITTSKEDEQQLDIAEQEREVGYLVGLANMSVNTFKEGFNLLKLAKDGVVFAANPKKQWGLIGKVGKVVIQGIENPDEALQSVKTLVKNSIEIGKNIAKDFSESFGVQATPEGMRWDADVAQEKLQEAPIQTILDYTLLGGLSKRMATKGIGYIASNTEKEAVKRVLTDNKDNLIDTLGIPKKGDLNKTQREAIKNASPSDQQKLIASYEAAQKQVKTPLEDMAGYRDVLAGFDIKQLDNPNYPKGLALEIGTDLTNWKKYDQKRLDTLLDGISDRPVNTKKTYSTIIGNLKERGILDNEGKFISTFPQDKENLIRDILEKDLKPDSRMDLATGFKAETPKTLTAKETKDRINLLGKSINDNKPDVGDIALKDTRRALRESLKDISPEYDRALLDVHYKLEDIGKKLEKTEDIGSKENAVFNFTKSVETEGALKAHLAKIDEPWARKIEGKIDSLQAWEKWNKYFNGVDLMGMPQSGASVLSSLNNMPFLGGIAVAGAKPILKRVKLSEYKKGLLNRAIPNPKSFVPGQKTRVGLEGSDIMQQQNQEGSVY